MALAWKESVEETGTMPPVVRIAVCLAVLGRCSWCVVDGTYGQNPPFSGTAYIHTDIITVADWSAFDSMTYTGPANRWVYDRRANEWLFQPMHLFDATFFDGLTSEIQINPEFGGQSAAAIEADKFARAVGRLPTSMRTDVDSVTVHKGLEPFGGGNRNILIHTDQADEYGEYLEEVLVHEAGHTSYDGDHASSPGWLAAQQQDPTFISTYARDNPTREDIAESILPWFALRYTNVLSIVQIDAINSSIPNRLAYFDTLPFQLNLPPTISGDFNGDGFVDAADYTVWQDNLGSGSEVLNGNGTGQAVVVQADYDLWKARLGEISAPASETDAVPEPCSLLLLGLGLAIVVSGHRKVAHKLNRWI